MEIVILGYKMPGLEKLSVKLIRRLFFITMGCMLSPQYVLVTVIRSQ